jgi:hypothetical protein
MKRFKPFVHEEDKNCKCPDGWTVLATFKNWCMCLSDEPEGMDDEEEDDDEDSEVSEGFIPSGRSGKSIEFPLVQFDDVVKVRLSPSGMYLKVGEGNFFLVPEDERQAIWRVIENRLHA